MVQGPTPSGAHYEMHISEFRHSSNTILTKCSKMTEEKHKRHGMNGNVDGGFKVKEESPKTSYTQGGRLKFFKDGKFILELERAREGERVSWVSVPRKTFWPPQGTAGTTPTYRQESSTSLSVSDDNSSIQSSPWQRDHSWKQPSPRRNLSREMSFYFWRPKHKRLSIKSRKLRRPYSTQPEPEELRVSCNSERTRAENSVCNNNRKSKPTARPSLLKVVQTLLEKSASAGTPPRPELVVSPRKRFLREMEKDKVQIDDGSQKRSRNKAAQVQSAAVATTVKIGSPVRHNGVTEDVKPVKNCSYSITSLLAEDKNVKRSPSNSPSHFNSVTQPQYCSSASDDRLYSENVDRLRSIELSQADKRGYPPYPYLAPYIYSYPVSPYYGPNVYGRGYIVPPVYHAPPMPLAVRHDAPSCSWAVEPPRDSEHIEDSITDMPLNLSKHAG